MDYLSISHISHTSKRWGPHTSSSVLSQREGRTPRYEHTPHMDCIKYQEEKQKPYTGLTCSQISTLSHRHGDQLAVCHQVLASLQLWHICGTDTRGDDKANQDFQSIAPQDWQLHINGREHLDRVQRRDVPLRAT